MGLKLDFNEPMIPVRDVLLTGTRSEKTTAARKWLWERTQCGRDFGDAHPNGSCFNAFKLHPDSPCGTLTAASGISGPYFWDEPVKPNELGYARLQTFPDDYGFAAEKAQYICGMSVPPYMMERVAHQIAVQLFGDTSMRALHHGPWKLTDLKNVRPNGLRVFSCFHCGGGSTMGYKLAGYDVLGGVEIDPKMMALYRANHSPRHSYLMGVREFCALPDLPDELHNLDILDGSPPCSSFSMAGSREKAWGKSKKFREGQAEQVLDDLFFDFIAIAKRLQPRVVIAENVKGLLTGKARGYVKQILAAFSDAGYDTQIFLLNASRMGVPQTRERVFFIARRRPTNGAGAKIDFNEQTVSMNAAIGNLGPQHRKMLTGKSLRYHQMTVPGESFAFAAGGKGWFGCVRPDGLRPAPTLVSNTPFYHPDLPREITRDETCAIQTFPIDYDFMKQSARYVCGMSVPPFMMERLSSQIASQLLL